MEELIRLPAKLGIEILAGSGLLLSATFIGWAIGRRRSFAPVRAVSWWMHVIVLPLLCCRSWGHRAAIIFLNNASVLAAMVASGVWMSTAVAAVAGVGLALGMALRALSELSPHWSSPSPNCPAEVRRRIRIGVTLNLLEPPAIALAVGLSLGRAGLPLDATASWQAFGLLVVPLLFAAACGEALWLGVGLRSEVTNEER